MQRLNLLFPYLLFGLIAAVVVLANVPSRSSKRPAAGATCMPCGMAVDPASALQRTVAGRDLMFCSSWCAEQVAQSGSDTASSNVTAQSAAGSKYMDVVCGMEVNVAWGISVTHDGQERHFCTQRCKELFVADPNEYLCTKCLVCKQTIEQTDAFQATYLGKTYLLCSAAHRQQFKAEPASYFMHSMWGIPSWLYYTSIAIVLVVSFGVFEWLGRKASRLAVRSSRAGASTGPVPPRPQTPTLAPALAMARSAPAPAAVLSLPVINLAALGNVVAAPPQVSRGQRFDLLSIQWIRAAVRSRVFRFTLQAVIAALFILVIIAGLWGNQNPALNIAPLLTWTIWWGLLPVMILFAGKIWCYVCPWDAMAGWVEKLKFWEKTDDGLSLNARWPRVVRNISIATVLFVGLTWVELGFGVTMSPRVTAYVAMGMLLLTVVSVLLFQRKSFCRYGCLVGRISGLYALFGAAEVRSRSAGVCESCKTKECVKGSDTAYGCPTFLYPGKLETNTYCIQCMECIQACPHDNLALNLRPWGSDLEVAGKPRSDEAYLALIMLSLTAFHGLTMTPVWQQMVDWIRSSADVGRVLGFSLGMAVIMLAPVALYASLVAVSYGFGRREAARASSYREYFVCYAYAVLPIALFYHIAHNLEHLLMEGPKIMALASDPLGWNWNLFGTAGWNVPPLISLASLWGLQAALVLIGHVYSLWVAQKTSLRFFGNSHAAFKSQLPMLIGMIAFSIFSLWLLKQPMEMRTSAM